MATPMKALMDLLRPDIGELCFFRRSSKAIGTLFIISISARVSPLIGDIRTSGQRAQSQRVRLAKVY